MDVLFERFISRERNEAPDIDVDFEHERREEVLQYLYEKYGRDTGRHDGGGHYLPAADRPFATWAKRWGCPWIESTRWPSRLRATHATTTLAERCREVGIDPESRTAGS